MRKRKPGKKGSRKCGRNKEKCQRYREEGRREKNKLAFLERKLRRLEKRWPLNTYVIKGLNIFCTKRASKEANVKARQSMMQLALSRTV